MAIRSETDLYEPIKAFLTEKGYEVRGEVKHCDIVAMRPGDEEPVIVELKKTFNLPLLIQGIERLMHTHQVYLGVERPESGKAPHGLKWSDLQRLCRMLGLGLITVKFYKRKKPSIEVICHPEPYTPRSNKKQTLRLITEFQERSGDYNVGGSSKRKIVTAYREKVLHCAYLLQQHGPMSPKRLKELSGLANVSLILQKNYYRWFAKVQRGIYQVNSLGEKALEEYNPVVHAYFSTKDKLKQSSTGKK